MPVYFSLRPDLAPHLSRTHNTWTGPSVSGSAQLAMPLDGHAHLVAQGWSGKGTGLRSGAIAKPITVIQKKNLGGVGKDRDEAFPFWDQYVCNLRKCLLALTSSSSVFQAASVSIQVKVHDSDDESVSFYPVYLIRP